MASFLGSRLAELRDQKRETQRSLAQKIGVDERTVQTWEQETSEPGGGNLTKLCTFFGVSQDYFYEEEGTGNASQSGLVIKSGRRNTMRIKALIANAEEILRSDSPFGEALERNIDAFWYGFSLEKKEAKNPLDTGRGVPP